MDAIQPLSTTTSPIDTPKRKKVCFPETSYNVLSPNKYIIDISYLYSKKHIYNILSECFEKLIGVDLPEHLFLEIWSRFEENDCDHEDYQDILHHIDDLYYDVIHKSARSHKKYKKPSIRTKRSYKFFIDTL